MFWRQANWVHWLTTLLFRKASEAEQHFRQAKRYASPMNKNFNIRLAVEEFYHAISLDPYKAEYHAELAQTYLHIPELAVVFRLDTPFEISQSLNLAVTEFEKAASLDSRYLPQLALCHYYLGNYEQVIRFAAGLQEGWQKSIPKDHVTLVISELRENRLQMERAMMFLQVVGKVVARHVNSGLTGFERELTKELLFIMKPERESLLAQAQPDKSKLYLEEALIYRNLGDRHKASEVFLKARQCAPSLAWWYNTLCQLQG